MSYSQKFIFNAILLESFFTTERSTNELGVKTKLAYVRKELLKHSQYADLS